MIDTAQAAHRRTGPVLGEQLATKIEQLIASQPLPPGSPLVERVLAERFQVSRSPIRDALRRLKNLGYRQHGGERRVFHQGDERIRQRRQGRAPQ